MEDCARLVSTREEHKSHITHSQFSNHSAHSHCNVSIIRWVFGECIMHSNKYVHLKIHQSLLPQQNCTVHTHSHRKPSGKVLFARASQTTVNKFLSARRYELWPCAYFCRIFSPALLLLLLLWLSLSNNEM